MSTKPFKTGLPSVKDFQQSRGTSEQAQDRAHMLIGGLWHTAEHNTLKAEVLCRLLEECSGRTIPPRKFSMVSELVDAALRRIYYQKRGDTLFGDQPLLFEMVVTATVLELSASWLPPARYCTECGASFLPQFTDSDLCDTCDS